MPFKNGKISKTRIAGLVGQSLLCLFILFSCGGDAGFDTGAVSFSLQWEDPVPANSVARYAAATPGFDVCSDYGVDTIHAAIYNASNSLIAQESWPCSAHEGIIHNVPAGANMRLELQGKSNGQVRWSGEKPNITVTAGQNTNTGTVTMDYTGGDNTRPTIISKTPSDNAFDISVNANITAIFSEKMAASSINDTTFYLKKDITSVSGIVTYNSSTNTATFKPSGSLFYTTTYTATITTGAEDMATNHMLNNYSWSFTTGDEGGYYATPGTPSNPDPSDGTIGVSIDADLDWPVCVNADSYDVYFGTSSNPPYAGNTNISSYSISPLSYNAHYYWKIIAKNDCGNSASSAVWDFITEDAPIFNTITIPSISYQMIYIPPGTFMMGSPTDERERGSYETQHQVTLTQGFYLGSTEVTQGQWRTIMGNNPSYFDSCGDDCPVEQVSWNDCQMFIEKLNQQLGSNKYRLPIEAEWEYACRAGTDTPFYFGMCLSTDQANYNGDLPYSAGCDKGVDRHTPISVKDLSPNAFGLYDMHGNVWEWCQDWFDSYPASNVIDPKGPLSGTGRILRGGGYDLGADICRTAARRNYSPSGRIYHLGFRLARSLDDAAPSAPTNVSSIAGDQQVTISWDNVSGATAYNIYWAETQGLTKANGTKISDVTSPYIHTGRTNGVTYYYVVIAENYYDESDESIEVEATPSDLPYNITQLTNNSHNDHSPQINNNGYVVWCGHDGHDDEIFLYNGSTTSQLTDNDYTEAFFYDGSTVTQVTDNDSIYDHYPQINNNGQIVWYGIEEGNYEIFLYDGSTIKNISNMPTNDAHPKINSNGWVVWQGGTDDGTDAEIFLYNGISTIQITDDTNDDQKPQINDNGLLVWKSFDGTDYEIFLYDRSIIIQLTNNDYSESDYKINEAGYVVWRGLDTTEGSDIEIFVYNGEKITQLTNSANDEYEVQINDNGLVVWKSFDGTDYEIFLAEPIVE